MRTPQPTILSDATVPDHLAATVWELNALTARQVVAWLADVLAGSRSLPVGMPGDGLADALVDLEPCLDDLARRAFHGAVRELALACVRGNDPEPLRALLHVAVQRDYRALGRDLANLVTRRPQEFDALPADCRCRILSAVRDLHATVTPGFWEALVQREPARFGGIALAALLASDPVRAIGVLPRLPPDPDLLADLFDVHLPLAWGEADPTRREQMRQALAAAVPKGPAATQEGFQRFARDMGIDLSPAEEALVPKVGNVDALLKRFKRGLEPTRAGLVALVA